jgi:Tol biopolymer transport system component
LGGYSVPILYRSTDIVSENSQKQGEFAFYDLYWMDIDTGKKERLTFAPGADVLPVFSPDYKKLMWTSTRDGMQPSQLYMADFIPPKD